MTFSSPFILCIFYNIHSLPHSSPPLPFAAVFLPYFLLHFLSLFLLLLLLLLLRLLLRALFHPPLIVQGCCFCTHLCNSRSTPFLLFAFVSRVMHCPLGHSSLPLPVCLRISLCLPIFLFLSVCLHSCLLYVSVSLSTRLFHQLVSPPHDTFSSLSFTTSFGP